MAAVRLLLLLSAAAMAHCLPTVPPAAYSAVGQQQPQALDADLMPPALEETIEEVQKILQTDPTLPRLTRGEIEELYEKVTREEYQKSVAAGDMGRADSMRALMLVLPYNTDNNTEENLQELYTRPPVTKVIEAYTPPQPIKFLTADPATTPKADQTAHAVGQMAATTYKPAYALKLAPATAPDPTTYHPAPPPPVMYRMQPSLPHTAAMHFQPVTQPPPLDLLAYGAAAAQPLDTEQSVKPAAQRYSSHYSAKQADFLRRKPQTPYAAAAVATGTTTTATSTSTVMPVADVLESLGIVGQTQQRQRLRQRHTTTIADDYYAAESAPQPVISTYVPPPLQQQPAGHNSYAPQIRPEAYSSFKPLNIGEEIRAKPEVEGYLTRFGIVGGRKRKALKKHVTDDDDNGVEQAGEQTEIAAARVPAGSANELEKLLENLQELERLNARPRAATVTTTVKPTTTTTTTTTTTPAPPPPTTGNLITNGVPLLVEAKKPRRRIDPHFDLNYGAASNQQTAPQSNDEQLAKLLANLQELERLKIEPQAVLKTAAATGGNGNPRAMPVTSAPAAATTTTTTATPLMMTTTPAPVRAQAIANRFSEYDFVPPQPVMRQQQAAKTSQTAAATQQADFLQLQRVLKELQAFEQSANGGRATSTPATTTTTTASSRRPSAQRPAANQLNFGLNDFSQLRKLLTDDRELERLYEQARGKKAAAAATTTTTTSTSTTTKRPAPNLNDLQQLQMYLAAFDRRGTAPSSAVAATTTTTPPPKPTVAVLTPSLLAQRIAFGQVGQSSVVVPPPRPATASNAAAGLAAGNNAELLALINRVQQLERLSNRPSTTTTSTSTTTTTTRPQPTNAPAQAAPPFLGFTSRNVNAPQVTASDLRVPSNDFAQLQQLYKQAAQSDDANERIEIATAASMAKVGGAGQRRQPAVEANDFVQLQKLLSKVQELERVKIKPESVKWTGPSAAPTEAPTLASAASVPAINVQQLNSISSNTASAPRLIYPERPHTTYQQFEDSLLQADDDAFELADLKLDLPAYELSTIGPNAHVKKKDGVLNEEPTSSSEELRDIVLAAPAHRGQKENEASGNDRQQFQQFFGRLNEAERDAYKQLQPPMIQKTAPPTLAKQAPRFIATRRPPSDVPQTGSGASKQSDLAELQKLLNNAQELEKLGITLPAELSQQIEKKLSVSNALPPVAAAAPLLVTPQPMLPSAGTAKEMTVGATAKSATTTRVETTSQQEEANTLPAEKTVVFSVTTVKSPTSKMPKKPSVDETSLELPIISYNKVIEAAVRQAASRFGFSTEQPQGFRRRSDSHVAGDGADAFAAETQPDDDLMADYSELSYQMAVAPPEINRMAVVEENAMANSEALQRAEGVAAVDADSGAQDLAELQRLIGNLQELQRLNVSVSSELLQQADTRYLQSFKDTTRTADGGTAGDADAAEKSRRQSETPAAATPEETPLTSTATPTLMIVTPESVAAQPEEDVTELPTTTTSTTAAPSTSSTSAPTRINLDLGGGISDTETAETNNADSSGSDGHSSSTTEAASSSTTEDEPRNGSLADLEDSFGPDPNMETASLPPKKKNGFYFLADWNSFLEVGDGDDQVVVRFSPKIGDPRLFLPVKVP